MKKLVLAAAMFVVALFGMSSAANATIVSHGNGDPVTANGDVSLRGAFVNTLCSISLDGEVADNGLRVTNIVGGSTGCTLGTLDITSVGDKVYGLDGGVLDGTWSVSITATLTASIVGTCGYAGTLSGTWAYDPGVGTVLTITSDTLVRTSGGFLCTADPIVTGDLILLEVETA